ncbi:MAG: iron ABC transporter permease, partial [Pseudomonadota bacterium]
MRIGATPLLLILSIVALGAVALAVTAGSADLSLAAVFRAIGADGGSDGYIVALRAERAAIAFAVGGLLALAGLSMQVLLRNPLADPYVLGTSGGAAVAALGAGLLGFGGLWVDLSAFAGALGATLLVFTVARRDGGLAPERLLLTGVVLAAGFGAVISVLLALAPDYGIKGMLFWLMGDFSFSRYPGGVWSLLALAAGVAWLYSRDLNVLARGARQAQVLGQAVGRVQLALFVGASLLTAVAVSTAGPVGFVGLVVPHLVRLLAGSDHRIVIPASVLAGGSLLVLADTLARTIV